MERTFYFSSILYNFILIRPKLFHFEEVRVFSVGLTFPLHCVLGGTRTHSLAVGLDSQCSLFSNEKLLYWNTLDKLC